MPKPPGAFGIEDLNGNDFMKKLSDTVENLYKDSFNDGSPNHPAQQQAAKANPEKVVTVKNDVPKNAPEPGSEIPLPPPVVESTQGKFKQDHKDMFLNMLAGKSFSILSVTNSEIVVAKDGSRFEIRAM